MKQIEGELPALKASRDVLRINTLSAEEVISAATDLYTQWPNLTREEQRSIIEAIVDRITVGKEEISLSLLAASHLSAGSLATNNQPFGRRCGSPEGPAIATRLAIDGESVSQQHPHHAQCASVRHRLRGT
jgi:hypothetical protein